MTFGYQMRRRLSDFAAPALTLSSGAQCQSNKGGHLIPSFNISQHDWEQTIRYKRLLINLQQGDHCLFPELLEYQTHKQGTPGIIISASSIIVGTFGTLHELNAEQISIERPMAGHYLQYIEIHLSMGSSQLCLEAAY